MADKAVIVIAFDLGTQEEFQAILSSVKPIFEHQPEVKVYGAVRDSADFIIRALEEVNGGG